MKSIRYKKRFMNFIVGFAVGTMITLKIAKPQSEIGCIVIGLLFGFLYMEYSNSVSRNLQLSRGTKE